VGIAHAFLRFYLHLLERVSAVGGSAPQRHRCLNGERRGSQGDRGADPVALAL